MQLHDNDVDDCKCPMCTLTEEDRVKYAADTFDLNLTASEVVNILSCLGLMIDTVDEADLIKSLASLHSTLGKQLTGMEGDVFDARGTNPIVFHMLAETSAALIRNMHKHGLIDMKEIAREMGKASGQLDSEGFEMGMMSFQLK